MPALRKPSLTSLPLQMSLHYNALFSVVFIVLSGSVAVEKVWRYEYSSALQRGLLLPVVSIWLLAEIARLYFGFKGNLGERVPDTAAYILISIFPQLPITIFLGFFQEIRFPIDYILGSMMLVFLFVEYAIGYNTIRMFIRSQTALFLRLCEEEQ